jgi:hypothetical protein
MCVDKSQLTPVEQQLLDILRALALGTTPPARCSAKPAVTSMWPGYPNPTAVSALNAAIQGLARRRCIDDRLQSLCLTDCGMRTIGLLPADPNGQC